jgi:hypothetical protein
MRFAAARVHSRFVAILADDDIFLPSSLHVLVQKLVLSPNASSAIGRTFRFHVSDGAFRGSQRYDYDCMFTMDHENGSSVSNIVQNLTNQYNYYAVFRREAWLKIVEVAFGIDYSCPYTSEVAIRLLGVMRGDGLVVEVLWWLRSDEVVPVSVKGWERKVSFEDWYRSSETVDERERFVQLLADFGVERELWSKEDANRCVNEVIESYLDATSTPQSSWSNRVLSEIAKRSKVLPRGARSLLKGALSYRQSQRLGIGSSLDLVKVQLREKGIEYEEDELDRITEVILQSNH